MSGLASTVQNTVVFDLPRSIDRVALLQALCALVWVPQAAVLAFAISQLQQGGALQSAWMPALAVVLLGILRAVLESWASTRLHDSARACLGQWRLDALRVVSAQSPLDRGRIPAGAAASIISDQAEAIMPWLTRYRMVSFRARLLPLLILLPVLWYSWAAALVLVVAAPLIPIFMAIVGWRAKAASEAQWLQLGAMNAFLLDRLRGLPTLRAFDAITPTAQRLRATAEELRLRTLRVLRIAFLSSAVLELFSALGVALVAVYVGFHLLGHIELGAWGQKLTLAEGLFILLLAPSFFEPLRELAAVWHDKASGQAAVDALKHLVHAGLPVVQGSASEGDARQFHEAPQTLETTALRQGPAVTVRSLHFAFPGEAPVFSGLDIDIAPGEKVALVGPSGAGKTVLLSLLAGLLPADSGSITLAGDLLTPDFVDRLRAGMGWMGQRPHVFSGSVTRNVALSAASFSPEQLTQAISSAGLSKVRQAHPGAMLGEWGVGLSGGEAARLALARLLIATHRTLWLVDEPTAHLDHETAGVIRQTLLSGAQGRTLVVATHDPLLIARMDRVIQMGSCALLSKERGQA